MASTIDDITMNYQEDDLVIVKELDKVVLSRGAWTTILFRYQQWDRGKEEYGPEKYSIRRYRKMSGAFMQQSKFNISNRDQAQKIIDALSIWLKK